MTSQPYHIVRNSKIHGRGVFAKRPIRKGTKIIEYTGKIVTGKEADKIGATSDNGHSHTMLFSLGDDKVINGNVGGDAKYINHSCAPNAETVQYEDRIFIEALRSIPQGEEITYDYHLEVDGKINKKVLKEYACFCGAPNCRGTQIAASLLKKQAQKDAEKQKAKAQKAELKAMKKKQKEEAKAAKKQQKEQDKATKKKKKEGKKSKKSSHSSLMVDKSGTTSGSQKKKQDKKKKSKKK